MGQGKVKNLTFRTYQFVRRRFLDFKALTSQSPMIIRHYNCAELTDPFVNNKNIIYFFTKPLFLNLHVLESASDGENIFNIDNSQPLETVICQIKQIIDQAGN